MNTPHHWQLFAKARHPLAFFTIVIVAALAAVATDAANFSIGLRSIGSSAPRVVGLGEIGTIFLGLIGASLGVSGLKTWEETAALQFRSPYGAWSALVLLSSPLPLALAPLGVMRSSSPGLSDTEWLPYAYRSIIPFALWAIIFVALGLVAVVALGRIVGSIATLAVFFAATFAQSQFSSHLIDLPIPGTPQPEDMAVQTSTFASLVAIALVSASVAVLTWSCYGSRQPLFALREK